MTKRRNNQVKPLETTDHSKKESWLEGSFNRIIAIVVGIGTIFSFGFYIGDFKKDLENKVEILKAQQECNVLVQSERDKCSEIRKTFEAQKIDELSITIKELSKIKGGKSEK